MPGAYQRNYPYLMVMLIEAQIINGNEGNCIYVKFNKPVTLF